MASRRIAILGGSGFVGRHLSARLHHDGHKVVIFTRRPERSRASAVVPSVHLQSVNVFDEKALTNALADCDTVVNLIGILNESRANDFQRVHVELARTLVHASHAAGISRMLHMSALNADAGAGASKYLRSKGEGENVAHTTGKPKIAVTSFRPSVIFGPDDSFFNRFAQLLKLGPVMPLACPNARFAPVYVEDVVDAMAMSLADDATIGQSYELCGPKTYTLEALVRYTAQCIGSSTRIRPMGDMASRIQAILLGMAPGKPFTLDNYHSMSKDSVCQSNGFGHFGIKPRAIEGIAPRFLSRGRERDRFNALRGHARR
ncbi:MAG: complex I NDUFA9 subunit family protein [Gammaproteobacteria bacterium]